MLTHAISNCRVGEKDRVVLLDSTMTALDHAEGNGDRPKNKTSDLDRSRSFFVAFKSY